MFSGQVNAVGISGLQLETAYRGNKKNQTLEWILGKDAVSTKYEVNYLPKFTWLANSSEISKCHARSTGVLYILSSATQKNMDCYFL